MKLPEKTVLGLDTSGKYASCAIYRGKKLLAETSFLTSLTHSQIIIPTIRRTVADAGLNLSDIELYAVASGPGSYTGLRIGIATIKGLCALGKPCIGISTLEAMAYNAFQPGMILPIMYARPGVIYYGGYLCDGYKMAPKISDRVGEAEELRDLVMKHSENVVLAGDMAEEIKGKIFPDLDTVMIAAPNQSAVNAAGVCVAALDRYQEATAADMLRASYLQNTMAEKLKDREAAK